MISKDLASSLIQRIIVILLTMRKIYDHVQLLTVSSVITFYERGYSVIGTMNNRLSLPPHTISYIYL